MPDERGVLGDKLTAAESFFRAHLGSGAWWARQSPGRVSAGDSGEIWGSWEFTRRRLNAQQVQDACWVRPRWASPHGEVLPAGVPASPSPAAARIVPRVSTIQTPAHRSPLLCLPHLPHLSLSVLFFNWEAVLLATEKPHSITAPAADAAGPGLVPVPRSVFGGDASRPELRRVRGELSRPLRSPDLCGDARGSV